MDTRRLDPRLVAALGAAFISLSAIFTKLSGTTAGTAAFYRCVLALLILVPLALREGGRWRLFDVLGGVLLGVDFVLWGRSIADVGAGIATVAVNIQVLIVPMLALIFTGERPSRRFWIAVPVIIGGVALTGGVLDVQAFGENPIRGVLFAAAAGVAYGIYLFRLRRGGQGGQRFVPVCAATVGAAVGSLALGSVYGGIDFTPGWPAFGWLIALALSGQVIGWLLIGFALPRLNSGVGATLLLVQPIGAVAFGILLLHEQLGLWQAVGCALVVLVVWFTATGSQSKRRSASAAEGNLAGAPAGHQPVASSR